MYLLFFAIHYRELRLVVHLADVRSGRGQGDEEKRHVATEEEEDNASKRWTQRAIPETFDQK